MAFILDKVSYRYSEGTAYEMTALDQVSLQIQGRSVQPAIQQLQLAQEM